MSLLELRNKIEQKKARLAVIGLGYVGLPVAVLFAESSFDVLGIELQPERVNKINAGISPIEGNEPGLAELLAAVIGSGRLRASTDYQKLQTCDVVLIDVETPVDMDHVPRYEALRAALRDLAPVMKAGVLVIVESTISPGTMETVALPLLEASGKKLNQDFFLGNCPERVMPGKLIKNLRSLSRVVGGGSPETAETMCVLYRTIVEGELDLTDWITAELVKTVENAYRDVQIAFANEVALICEALGGDAWKVRELVNKSPFRQVHLPGAGVGGHCIPKDPWLLAYSAAGHDLALKIIPSAREVNDGMPYQVAKLLEGALSEIGCQMAGARVLVMGYAYLENSDDYRNSPSIVLVDYLKRRGVEVVIHDPYVRLYRGDLAELAKDCDAAVVMVAHDQYKSFDLDEFKSILRYPVIVDGRNVFPELRQSAQGWVYRGIGFRAKE
jgi:UDP-N-acetyl-D-mannosaminuronic acid dehydrogenase